jgi:hypothetical protein
MRGLQHLLGHPINYRTGFTATLSCVARSSPRSGQNPLLWQIPSLLSFCSRTHRNSFLFWSVRFTPDPDLPLEIRFGEAPHDGATHCWGTDFAWRPAPKPDACAEELNRRNNMIDHIRLDFPADRFFGIPFARDVSRTANLSLSNRSRAAEVASNRGGKQGELDMPFQQLQPSNSANFRRERPSIPVGPNFDNWRREWDSNPR